jgi:hypothetical protein
LAQLFEIQQSNVQEAGIVRIRNLQNVTMVRRMNMKVRRQVETDQEVFVTVNGGASLVSNLKLSALDFWIILLSMCLIL